MDIVFITPKSEPSKSSFVVNLKCDDSWNRNVKMNPVLNELNNDRILYCICFR